MTVQELARALPGLDATAPHDPDWVAAAHREFTITDISELPLEPLISVVTLAELSVGPLVATSEPERVARQAHLQQAEADFKPLVFDPAAARRLGHVAASLRRAGYKPAARSFDAMIAATAPAHDIPVHTCNPDDFAGIDDLEVVAVQHPDR